jgi:hypothetical protein
MKVSNITDQGNVDLARSLATFGSLLKRKGQNPHAALLALYLNAIHEVSLASDRVSSMLQATRHVSSN